MDQSIKEGLDELLEFFSREGPLSANSHALGGTREAAIKKVEQGESVDDVQDAYCRASDAYYALLRATNPNSWDKPDEELSPWRHQSFVPLPQEKKRREPYIDSPQVEEAIAIYLSGSLRSPSLDRALMDAVIASEMLAFFDEPGSKTSPFKLSALLLDWGVVALLLYFSGGVWWAWLVACGIVLYPFVIALLSRDIRTKRKQLVLAMMSAYQILDGSLVSVRELRRLLEAARDVGAVWLSCTWVLLEDIEARRTSL